MAANLFASSTKMYMHLDSSTKHSNLAQKPDVNKKYANFIPFVNQQEEDRLSNQLTSVTTGYINAMIDIRA